MTWYYNGEPLEEIPEGAHGFVYEITNKVTGKRYIGKKHFYSVTKLPPLKGKKRKRTKIKESKWKEYYGSNDQLLADVKEHGKDNFHREILRITYSKGETTYYEIAYQFKKDVLTETLDTGDKMYYNDNIAGRYFSDYSQATKDEKDGQDDSEN